METRQKQGQYLVMWHTWQQVNKRGFWNKIVGKKSRLLKPKVQTYDSEEIANYGYNTIRANRGVKPCILKVIRN